MQGTRQTRQRYLSASYEQAICIICVVVLLLRGVPLLAGTHIRPHHVPVGSGSDGGNNESIATLVAVAIAGFAKRRKKRHSYSYMSKTRTAALCNKSLFVHDIDGSDGEDNRLVIKRTRRVH